MTEFTPPIKSRSTEELLKILGADEKWEAEAVNQAKNELKFRKVESDKIEHAKYLAKKADQLEKLRKNKEYYSLDDFFRPGLGIKIFEILFSVELRKNGYLRKAEQQKYLRLIIILIIVLIIIYGGR